MNKKMKLSVVISLGFSMGLFLNQGFALQEPNSAPSAEQPPAKTEVEQKASSEQQKVGIEQLKKSVGEYFTAWTRKDFKTMRSFEDWTGGKELDDAEYIQSFKADFTLHTWKITKVSPLDDDRYQVLILITHNVPQNILAYLPKAKTVRSTLPKLWKKKGDKFVHLFHIEHQKIMEAFPQEPLKQSPAFPTPSSPAPKTAPTLPDTNSVPKPKTEPTPKMPESN